ncbi:MAG: ferritin family protein [Spirochaetales bacterium]|nr:ferritin family protein [Spirochaetales bacterium]
MEWFDTAIDIEKEGERFYRDLAEKAGSEGVKNIFTMLADDEVTHRKRFEAMKRDNFDVESAAAVTKEASKKLFSGTRKDHFESEQKHLEVYKQALDIEQKSIDFYQEKMKEASDSRVHAALEQIAAEEKFHYQMIDTLCIMVERPERWVEFAEFGVREDY